MAWTDERIEKLKRLWSEGLSASQIANQLGDVTRNAVIGKIHRLGLAARAKGATPPARPARPRPERREGQAQRAALAAPQPQVRSGAVAVGNTALDAAREEERTPAPAPAAEVVTLHGGVAFADIGPSMCRWPIGDPAEPDFRMCGRPTPVGQSYCCEHAARAFHNRGDRPPKAE